MDRTTSGRMGVRGALSCAALVAVLFGLDSVAGLLHAQVGDSILARVEDRTRVGARNRVVVRSLTDKVDREVYRSEGDIPDNVEVSPGGRYVSFVEFLGQATGGSAKRLLVVDVTGQVVLRLPSEGNRGIRRYEWCCGQDRIAVLRGSSRDDESFRAETLFIIDVRSGVEQPLSGIWRPYQMHWAVFDSSLYIKGLPPPGPQNGPNPVLPVHRYHVPTGRLTPTTRHGVFFSPDGRYYYDAWPSGPGFRLYRTVDDADVTAGLRLPSHQISAAPEGGWAPGTGHVLVFVERRAPPPSGETRVPRRHTAPVRIDPAAAQVYPDRWNLAVDAETGTVERFQGDVLAGWKTSARSLPIERRAGIEFVKPRRP